MANPMTLTRFLERADLGAHGTWEDAAVTVRRTREALDKANRRVEQLNDDLDRYRDQRARRRQRWADGGRAIFHGAIGAAVAVGGLYAREAGLWPW